MWIVKYLSSGVTVTEDGQGRIVTESITPVIRLPAITEECAPRPGDTSTTAHARVVSWETIPSSLKWDDFIAGRVFISQFAYLKSVKLSNCRSSCFIWFMTRAEIPRNFFLQALLINICHQIKSWTLTFEIIQVQFSMTFHSLIFMGAQTRVSSIIRTLSDTR